MTEDDDKLVEIARRLGDLGAIRVAAECLFSDVASLDHACRLMKGELELVDEASFRELTDRYVREIEQGVARLKGLLQTHPDLWDKLRLANPYPATLGDEFADCFASLAHTMGDHRIFQLRLIAGGGRRVVRQPLTHELLWGIRAELIDGFAEHTPFVVGLARLQLAKECQRVTGAVTRPVKRRGGRREVEAVAKRRREILMRHGRGEKPGAIADAMDLSVETVYADLKRVRSKSDTTTLPNFVQKKKTE